METSLSSGSHANPSTALNIVSQHLASPQSSKKRKREDNEQQHDRLGTIEATPLSESQTVKPFTLVLLATLSRSQVPLAWLDSASPVMQVPSRLIFDAKLPTNPGSQCTNLNGHVVLVVRQTPNGRLYAVESLGGNMYLGCLLSAWVTEEQVLAGQQNSSENFLLEKVLGAQTGPETREHARTNSQQGTPLHSFRPSPPEPKNRRGVLARMAIMPPKETTPASCSSILPDVHGEEAPSKPGQSPTKTYANGTRDVSSTSAAVPHPDICFVSNKDQSGTLWPALQQSNDPILVDTVEAQLPSTQIILETLHRQYLETLYVSKTSLAYFAKGPLVRARTQVQSLSTSSLSDLAEFCRDSVIPTKKMHQKYGDSIVTILQSLAAVQTPGRVEEAQETSTKPKAKQKSGKQRKVGKDGLYPNEKDLIEAWWHTTSRDLDVPKIEPSSSEMKTAIADLRTRETELQIILILEALALEGAEKATVDDHCTRPLIKEEPAEQGRDAALIHVPQFKKRKRQDLKSELDLLIDRLCIWQTVGLEEISGSSVESQKHGKMPGTGSNDALKDFCSDIIIPFYSARLPEQCKAVCHKLGVSQVTPKRPRKTLQKSLSTTGVLPGAVVRPSCGSISKRTLQRVLSEDQGSRHVSPPTLSRSSTVPLIPNLKREPTEPPSRPESRGGLQKSRSFANREVDLVNDARTQAMKQKKLAKLAKQKQEVDAAIDALRKPNRGLAAKEIADDMEKHRVERAKFSRRNGLAIQVDATPKKSAPKTTRQCPGPRYGEAATLPLPDLSFSQQPVLSSSLRPSTAGRAKDKLQRPTFTNTVPTMISDTPAHAVLKKSDPLGIAKRTENFEIFDTRNDKWDYSNQPCSQAESLVEATPSANRVRRDMLTNIQNTPLRMRKSQKPVLFTALDKADVTIDDTFKDAPEIPEQAGKAMARVMGGGSEMSIYDSLGWNDDLDE